MDFAVARCRQVRTFQSLTRQKTRKFIAAGLMRSIPVRLPFQNQTKFEKCPKIVYFPLYAQNSGIEFFLTNDSTRVLCYNIIVK
jgi:hypothetical protein